MMRFTYRLAQIRRAKLFMIRDIVEDETPTETANMLQKKHVSLWDNPDFLRRITRRLGGNRISYICMGIAFFILVPLMLFYPGNIGSFRGTVTRCSAAASILSVCIWFVWVVPYLWFVGGFSGYNDPFNIIWRLKLQTVWSIIVAFASFYVSARLESTIGTSHWALTIFDVVWTWMVMIWMTESYLTLYLTRKRIEEAHTADNTTHRLVDTLANPRLLEMFEDHLIEEWAPENLQFYKAVVMFKLDTLNALKRIQDRSKKDYVLTPEERGTMLLAVVRREAFRIYMAFIHDSANSQVNLPAYIFNDINKFFDGNVFNMLREEHQSRTWAETMYQPTSMMERFPAARFGDHHELSTVKNREAAPSPVPKDRGFDFNGAISPQNGTPMERSRTNLSTVENATGATDGLGVPVVQPPNTSYTACPGSVSSPVGVEVSHNSERQSGNSDPALNTTKSSMKTSMSGSNNPLNPHVGSKKGSRTKLGTQDVTSSPAQRRPNTKKKTKMSLITGQPITDPNPVVSSPKKHETKISLITGLPIPDTPPVDPSPTRTRKKTKMSLITGLPITDSAPVTPSPTKAKKKTKMSLITGLPITDTAPVDPSPTKTKKKTKMSLITGQPITETTPITPSPTGHKPKISLITGLPINDSTSLTRPEFKSRPPTNPRMVSLENPSVMNEPRSYGASSFENPSAIKPPSPGASAIFDRKATSSISRANNTESVDRKGSVYTMTRTNKEGKEDYMEKSRNSGEQASSGVTSPETRDRPGVKLSSLLKKKDKKAWKLARKLRMRKKKIRMFCEAVSLAAQADMKKSQMQSRNRSRSFSRDSRTSRTVENKPPSPEKKENLFAGLFNNSPVYDSQAMLGIQMLTDIMDTANIFEVAKKKVFQLMDTDSHHRFIGKPQVRKLIGMAV
ncbi:hypothetical protein AAMO2058_000826000 [Amorphochlora amoebiformis]